MKELINNLRNRLAEFRLASKGEPVNLHVNAIDISVALVEYALVEKREIRKEEEGWFSAGLMLAYFFENSEWEDLYTMYREMCKQVRGQNYFRKN